jgi:hypothetical protein
VKKEPWLFLIKLVVSSVVLGYLWFAFAQSAYPYFLKPVAIPFFQMVGVKTWRLTILIDHFSNIIPYIALIIATPGFIDNWKKSILTLLGGLIILMICHLLLSWLDYHFWAKYQTSKTFFRHIFHFYILNDALPFGLWILLYPRVLPQVFSFLRFGKISSKSEENTD